MTLDEGIKLAEEVVEEYRNSTNEWKRASASRHEQLAKWLKELKEIKQTNTAEWICIDRDNLYKCSKCWKYGVIKYNFCPNCGSRMKGEGQ